MRRIRPTRRHGSAPPPTALIVVAKAPVPGHVKTRLCPPLESDQAAILAGAALLDTIDAVSGDLLADAVQSVWREGVDAVLGPTDDGGWWALGLRPGVDSAFLADVPMSTTDTGALTLQAMTRAGLRVAILPTLTDVDTIADGHLVAAQIPAGRFAVALDSMLPARSKSPVPR